ncbi:hypothetical protein HJC23_008629 [Cyclotella cryptica]|uniref:Uncharacterized protein n=1 Tax=Cyclotella cryptica TaxID=29204 RepID=A0ABD3NU47_9STRA
MHSLINLMKTFGCSSASEMCAEVMCSTSELESSVKSANNAAFTECRRQCKSENNQDQAISHSMGKAII